jgi:DNA-binding NarL/FixJ family response regulator
MISSTAMKRKRILIADAHSTMLASLRVLLKDTFDVVFMVADDQSLIDAVARTDPDLVIVDLSIPVSSGENVARLLHRVSPELRVIILSIHDEQTVVDECLAAGARGFVLKRRAAIDLIPAVEDVLRGDIYVSPSVVSRQGNV